MTYNYNNYNTRLWNEMKVSLSVSLQEESGAVIGQVLLIDRCSDTIKILGRKFY